LYTKDILGHISGQGGKSRRFVEQAAYLVVVVKHLEDDEMIQ
jgi:hypothetical protein